MEINYYYNNIKDNEVALVLNSKYNKRYVINGESVRDYLLSVSNDRKVSKVLKMLGLDSSILNKRKNEIDNLEESLLIIAWQLLQNKYLVIYYLDSLLNYKEKIYLKRIISKIAHEYNIKTLVFTNDIKFCFNMIDKILIINDKQITAVLSNDFYNLKIYDYMDMPDIISFVSSNKSKKLENYTDISELLKGIYRLWQSIC